MARRGQTRLAASQRSMSRGAIEHRWHSHLRFLYGLCIRRWMMRCSPRCTSLPEPLRETLLRSLRKPVGWLLPRALPVRAPTRVPARWGPSSRPAEPQDRACNKASKTPFGRLAQLRMRQCARIGRCRNMIALDPLSRPRRRLSFSLKTAGRSWCAAAMPHTNVADACRLDASKRPYPTVAGRPRHFLCSTKA